jgi:hypothetical protein
MTEEEKEHADIGRYPLVLAEDGGGRRFFLRGKPVHRGTTLEVWCPTLSITVEGMPLGQDSSLKGWSAGLTAAPPSGWLRVRFGIDNGRPVIYLWLGVYLSEARVVCSDVMAFRWPDLAVHAEAQLELERRRAVDARHGIMTLVGRRGA